MNNTARIERKASRAASEARIKAAQLVAQNAAAANRCPDCGAHVHQNLAITGWVQCDRSGDGTFRRDPSGTKCFWQGFTR
jgi:hypothetical protein